MPSFRTQAADVINPTDGLTTSAAALWLKQSILCDTTPRLPKTPNRFLEKWQRHFPSYLLNKSPRKNEFM